MDDALQALDEAVKRNPGDAQSLLTIGEIEAGRDHTQGALDAYARAAKARKDWYEPHFRRGVLLLKEQQTDAAIDELQAAVRLDDVFAQGHYWLGRAYRAAGRYTDAVRDLRRAVALQGDYYEARYFLGRALDEQGSGADAVTIFTALATDAPEGDQWRAEAERELGRIK